MGKKNAINIQDVKIALQNVNITSQQISQHMLTNSSNPNLEYLQKLATEGMADFETVKLLAEGKDPFTDIQLERAS